MNLFIPFFSDLDILFQLAEIHFKIKAFAVKYTMTDPVLFKVIETKCSNVQEAYCAKYCVFKLCLYVNY